MNFARFCGGTLLLLMLCASPALAAEVCNLPQLAHQKQDVATVRHLEEAWSIAFLKGDTALLGCLLLPEYTEITRTGQVKYFRDELEMATVNLGKNLDVPALPVSSVLLHGDVAVAYGETRIGGAGSRGNARRFADFFLWRNGRWYAFFSQQTPIENP